MKEKFSVTGMTCSACSAGIERVLNKKEGVDFCEVSLMAESMQIEYDPKKIKREDIVAAVQSLGYGASPYDEKLSAQKKPKANKLLVRFVLSMAFLLPLMYFSMGGMLGAPVPPFEVNAWIQAALSAVVIGINYAFFASGTKALIKKVPNMDTLVALGSAVSYGYSLTLTILRVCAVEVPSDHLFYESAALILALVTLGKWLEEKSKRKRGEEVEKLIGMMPSTVLVERNGVETTIEFSEIVVGDILIVKNGDFIPVDGKVIEGHAFVNRAAITGESLPVEVAEGDNVTSADIVVSGYIKMLAEKVGVDTTLSQIVKMVKEAGASKAPIQKIADKIAGVFVPAVLLIAVFTFVLWWALGGDVGAAANYAISVLVISCPCSLGLATPVAIMAATGKGMSLGVLYKDAEALQKAKEINCVLLDKTATLTIGKPKVTDFYLMAGDEQEVLNIAYAIESQSNHPIAECVKAYASERATILKKNVEEYKYEIGEGARGTIDGKAYRLGNRKSLAEKLRKVASKKEKEYETAGKTVVFLSTTDKIVAVFAIADELKETSKDVVSSLKERDIKVGMLTGDNEEVAKAIAEKVGITDYYAEALPEDKKAAVERVQNVGGIVAMVGDGINDSPALKAADVGVAIGTGTDVAIDSAAIVLVGGDLTALPVAIDLSKATVKNIKQNLFWAFFYNCIAIPVAAGALSFIGVSLNPMIAAACMSLSSLFVVTNALRLTAFGKKKKEKRVLETVANDTVDKTENQQVKTLEKDEKVEAGMRKTIKIDGMMCQHCVRHVLKALEGVDGVTDVVVSLEEKQATLSASGVTDDALIAAVQEAGYEVLSVD